MRSSTWWMIGAIICMIGGLAAIFNPVAGTMAATAIAAWSFIIFGIIQLIAVFMIKGGWNKLLLALFGVLGILVGITVINNPLVSILSLTMAVAIFVILSGVVRLFVANDVKGTPAFGWVMVSAILSILLGILILANFPVSAATILGLLLGIELLFSGIAMFGLSQAAKRAPATA